jgi:hypothetical protein
MLNGYKPMSNRSFKSEMEALKFYYGKDKATRTIRIIKRLKLAPSKLSKYDPNQPKQAKF